MGTLSTLNSDYDSLKQLIVENLQSSGEIGRLLTESEAGVIAAELMAGITSMFNYKLDMAVLNSYMPTAFTRTAVHNLAMMTGGSPRRRVGSKVTVQFTVTSSHTTNVVIPKNTVFQFKGLLWYNKEEYIITPTNLTFSLDLYQGEKQSSTFTANGLQFQRYTVGSSFDIDDFSIVVTVSGSEWEKEKRSLINRKLGSDLSTDAYLEQTMSDGTVNLLFGNGEYGSLPLQGQQIVIDYYTTVGASGNTSTVGDSVKLTDTISTSDGDLKLTGATTTIASGGLDEESIEEIKFTSPRLFAANERAVLRDDYEAYLRRFSGVLAAKVWGEYEEALRKGTADKSMMNTTYFTLVRSVLGEKSQVIGTVNNSDTDYNITLPDANSIQGSLIITSDSTTWYDIGDGIISSDDISFNGLVGGSATSSGNGGGTLPSQAFDGDEDSFWQSDIQPTDNQRVYLTYDLGSGNSLIASSIRFKASKIAIRKTRAFPTKFVLLGSNKVSPDPTEASDWDIILGATSISDPGVGNFSRWIPVLSTMGYRHFTIQIATSLGDDSVKIAEIEIGSDDSKSTINYTTGGIFLKYNTPPVAGDLVGKYKISDYSQSEIDDIIEYMSQFKYMNNELLFSNPIARPVDVEVDAYYESTVVDPNTLKVKVELEIQKIFDINSESFGRDVKLSDVYSKVKAVTGVDSCDVLLPSDNIIISIREFPILNNLKVNMFKESR